MKDARDEQMQGPKTAALALHTEKANIQYFGEQAFVMNVKIVLYIISSQVLVSRDLIIEPLPRIPSPTP